MKIDIVATIDDPWDVGEAMKWRQIPGTLNLEKSDIAILELEESIKFLNKSSKVFEVSPRHDERNFQNLSHSGISCNGWSKDDKNLRIILTIKTR